MCEQALDVFVSIYGAEAGNLALKFKATGGVFVGGGIAPKIVEKLKAPVFIEAFKAKGRMRRLLSLFRMDFVNASDMRKDITGRPVYMALSANEEDIVRMKPQNLLVNLPMAQPS